MQPQYYFRPDRPHRRRLATWLVVLLAAQCSAHARPSAADLPPEKVAAIDAKINAFMAKSHAPGMSLAVVIDGAIVYDRGYGLADVENNVPATAETIYRLASISKMLTGVAAMQLVEQGKLDLAAPIQKYVPDFPEKQAPITAEHLLKHQSGIRHYKGDETKSAKHYRGVKDALVIFRDEPLLFAPGEKFSYTTYGYNLLGAAVESAAGQPYARYVQAKIAAPAGMTSLQPDDAHKIIPHRAAGYRLEGTAAVSVLVNDDMVDVSNKVPGGGWCSTAGDLGRFAIALVDGKLVSPGTLERMWTPQATASGESTRSGLGCFVEEVNGERQVAHSGGQPKVSTYLLIIPSRRAAVAMMCNLSGHPLKPLAGEVAELLR